MQGRYEDKSMFHSGLNTSTPHHYFRCASLVTNDGVNKGKIHSHFWNDTGTVLTTRPDSASPDMYGDEPLQGREQLCHALAEEARNRFGSVAIDLDFASKPPQTDVVRC